MKLGAYHFANKPFNLDDVAATVERALETTRLRREVRQFRANAARPFSLPRIVGASRQITSLRHLVARVAAALSTCCSRRERYGEDLCDGHPLFDDPGRQAVMNTLRGAAEHCSKAALRPERCPSQDARLRKACSRPRIGVPCSSTKSRDDSRSRQRSAVLEEKASSAGWLVDFRPTSG